MIDFWSILTPFEVSFAFLRPGAGGAGRGGWLCHQQKLA